MNDHVKRKSSLAEAIGVRIAAGEWPVGSRLPTQSQLAQEYGVTRHIMRGALQILERQDKIGTRQGSGIFVTGHVLDYFINSHSRNGAMLAEPKQAPDIRVLELETRRASAQEARSLKLQPGEPLHDLRTLRYSGAQPLCLERHRLSAQRFPNLAQYLPEATGINEALERMGVSGMHRNDTAISARHPKRTEARMLHISPDSPVVVLEGRNIDRSGRPLELCTSLWPAARIRVHV